MVVNKERHYEYRTYHIPAGKYKTSPGIKSIIIYYFAPNDEEEKDDNNDDGGTNRNVDSISVPVLNGPSAARNCNWWFLWCVDIDVVL